MTFIDKYDDTFPTMTREILPKNTIELALFLLGQLIVRVLPDGEMAAQIVETEAYPPNDPAAHAYRRMTVRNRSLFLDRGYAYVYRAYGVSFMLNVSSESAGQGAGILIRAVEPVRGQRKMQVRRPLINERDVTRGPGRLAKAMEIDRTLDGCDLCSPGQLYLSPGMAPPGSIGVSRRIGITRAVEAPWRFYLRGNRFVSGPNRLNR